MKEDTHNNEGNSTLLDSLPKLNCFRVPDGYFDRMHQAIALKVQLEGLPFEDALEGLKKAQPYALPDNYFDSLANKIAAKTQPMELPQETGFAVPEGYFQILYLKVVDKVAQENAPKVWWQSAGVVLRPALAIAAVVTVAVFIALPYLNNNETAPVNVATNKPVTNDYKGNTPNNTTVETVVTPTVKTVAETAKNTTTKGVAKNIKTDNTNTVVAIEAAELFDYADDFSAEGLLSEAPEKISDDDNSLVEIVSEEKLDLAELIDGM